MQAGNNLYLTKIKKEDFEKIYEWFKDVDFLKFYDYVPPVPHEKDEVDKIFDNYEKSEEDELFAIRILKVSDIL